MRIGKNINHIPYTVYKFCSNTEIIMKRFDVEPLLLSGIQCERFYEKALLLGEKISEKKGRKRIGSFIQPSPAKYVDIFILTIYVFNHFEDQKSFERNITLIIIQMYIHIAAFHIFPFFIIFQIVSTHVISIHILDRLRFCRKPFNF